MNLDIEAEARELRGHFPDLTTCDFYRLDNGNVGVLITFKTSDLFGEDFDVLLEYPPGYPETIPNAWVQSPKIASSCRHVWKREEGDVKICYLRPSKWESNYTSYDAAAMIKSWIYAYVEWKDSGEWDWEEAH